LLNDVSVRVEQDSQQMDKCNSFGLKNILEWIIGWLKPTNATIIGNINAVFSVDETGGVNFIEKRRCWICQIDNLLHRVQASVPGEEESQVLVVNL